VSLNWGLSCVEHESFFVQIWGFILCKYKGMSVFAVAIYARFGNIYIFFLQKLSDTIN
jgi:hypothetical protein